MILLRTDAPLVRTVAKPCQGLLVSRCTCRRSVGACRGVGAFFGIGTAVSRRILQRFVVFGRQRSERSSFTAAASKRCGHQRQRRDQAATLAHASGLGRRFQWPVHGWTEDSCALEGCSGLEHPQARAPETLSFRWRLRKRTRFCMCYGVSGSRQGRGQVRTRHQLGASSRPSLWPAAAARWPVATCPGRQGSG